MKKIAIVLLAPLIIGCVSGTNFKQTASTGAYCEVLDAGVDNAFRPSHSTVMVKCVDSSGTTVAEQVTTEFSTGAIQSLAGPALDGAIAGHFIGEGLEDSGDNIDVSGGSQVQGQAQGQIQGQKQKSVGGCQGNCN